MRRINILFDEGALPKIRTPDSEFQTEFLRFCVGIIRIPIAMYHFYAAGRFFELDYLRRLKKRNETHFAVAAHDCFNSEQFWDEIEAAIMDYAAQYSSSLSIPISRYNQLRRVAYLCAEGWDSSDAELVKVVCGELNVSAKVAGALIKEYRTLFCVRQLGDDVFSISCGGDPAVTYDRLMRRTLLMQRMEEVLTPRELNLVRSYLGIGQPDEVGMTFQELAIYLNYNGPSGAEKAYKAALRKLKKDLYGGAYSRWLSAQKAIRAAKAEAEADPGHYTTPQTTWLDEKELMERFICEVVSLIRVHEIFSDALENIAAKIFEES